MDFIISNEISKHSVAAHEYRRKAKLLGTIKERQRKVRKLETRFHLKEE